MNIASKPHTKMTPISGRIPDDLYQWLSTASIDGATTMSDKLRVGVATLKRLQDGDADYAGALAMYRDLMSHTRHQLSALELTHGHSEVMGIVFEHAPAIAAALTSAQVGGVHEARQLEDQVTRRCMQLAESLLRQALTCDASAHDPGVIVRHSKRLIELARLIDKAALGVSPSQPTPQQGVQHG